MNTRWASAAAAWLFGVAVVAAAAEPIQVTPVVTDRKVTASFSAPASFGPDVQEMIQSGLLVTLTFTAELRRPSTIWLDHSLSVVTVASSVKFDNLTGVYQVSKLERGKVVWSERTKDLAQVRSWMTTFDRVSLASDQPLEPNSEYYVRVRMQASPKRTFSFWFWPWSGDKASGRADFTFIR
jgi:hypothetical protein